MSQCSEPRCNFFAGPSGFCSRHTEEGKAQTAAEQLEDAAKNKRKLQELRDGATWWVHNRVPYPAGYRPKCLVLGASPSEERRGRDHYDDPNVFLLGHENRQAPRYIQANFNPDARDPRLKKASTDHVNSFDEIAFDGSTMCGFGGPADSMVPIFRYFYKMLKDNGVFFLSDYTPQIKAALELTGFLVHRVRVLDLGGTIVSRLAFPDDSIVFVAIKRPAGGAAAPAPLAHEAQGGRRKKTRKTRKSKKTRRH